MRNNNATGIFIISLVLSFIVLITANLTPLSSIKNIVIKIVFTTEQVIETPLMNSSKLYSRLKELIQNYNQNSELKSRINTLEKQYSDYEYYKNENIRLKNIFNLTNEDLGRIIMTKTVSQTSEQFFNELIIDKGSDNGVKINSPVVGIRGGKWYLMGRVSEVYSTSSKIIILTSPNFRCSVELIDGTLAILRGTGSWILKVSYIAPNAQLKKGHIIYSSDRGGLFPSGIITGIVDSVKILDFSTGKEADVKGIYYPQNFKYLYVLRK